MRSVSQNQICRGEHNIQFSGLFLQTVGAAIVVESTIVPFFRISPFVVSCSTACEKAFPELVF